MILQLWLVEVPENTVLFCRLILLQSLISCIQRPFVMAIHATGRMKIINLTAGFVLLAVLPISYILLKIGFPVYIPFIIYIGATLIEFSVELFFLHKWIYLPLTKLLKSVLIPISLVIISSLPVSMITNYLLKDGIMSVLLVFIISTFLVFISVYYIAFSKGLRISIINKIINRRI
jgi:hypothetical protein